MLFTARRFSFGRRRPGPPRLVKAPVAVHPLPQGGISARITIKGTRKPALAGGILWPTASQPWDADGTRDSSAPVGAASGGPQAKNMACVPTTRCRPLRGSAPLLLRPFPRLARRGHPALRDRHCRGSDFAQCAYPSAYAPKGERASFARPENPSKNVETPG